MAGGRARSPRLGDVGASAPSCWRWGGRYAPDVLMVRCASAGCPPGGAQVATADFERGFAVLEELPTTDMGQREPVRLRDGISQPRLDWEGRRTPGTNAISHTATSSCPRVLARLPQRIRLYTDRPLLAPGVDGAGDLPFAADDPSKRDLGRNGSYLVLASSIRTCVASGAFAAAHASGVEGAEHLAAKLVGRHRSGEPLVPGTHPIEGIGDGADAIRQNGFTFDDDTDGLRCRSAPYPRATRVPATCRRTAGGDLAAPPLGQSLQPHLREDLIAAARFHRILRRGREFGADLEPERAMQPDAADPRSGLHFICLTPTSSASSSSSRTPG